MSFEIKTVEVKGNQLNVDLVLYSRETTVFELTFERKRIESLGIDWKQFAKSVDEVISELRVKADARSTVGG